MAKLNHRLQILFNTIKTGYDEIWDCCCDHGYLGMAIMQANLCTYVHFVDQVASITETVNTNLKRFKIADSSACQYDVITEAAEKLSLLPDKKHLIILAGVSGTTVISIMRGILEKNPLINIDFLISPNYQLFTVREFLNRQNFNLIHEELIFENAQVYEMLLVSNDINEKPKTPISLAGNMWQLNNKLHREYLNKLIFQARNKYNNGNNDEQKRALLEYEKVLLG